MERTILVITKDANTGYILRLALGAEGFHVEVATDGVPVVELLRRSGTALVILDLNRTAVDDIEACRQVRSCDQVPVIILNDDADVDEKVRLLNEGADDYIVKPFDVQELVARIRSLLRRRGKEMAVKELRFEHLSMRLDTREVLRNGTPIRLTALEFELLLLLMRHPRQAFSRESIIRRVWGYDLTGDSNFVEACVSRLRHKLGEPSLIRAIREVGYALRRG